MVPPWKVEESAVDHHGEGDPVTNHLVITKGWMRDVSVLRDVVAVGEDDGHALLTDDFASGRVTSLSASGRMAAYDNEGRPCWSGSLSACLDPPCAAGGWFAAEYVVELSGIVVCHADGTLAVVSPAGLAGSGALVSAAVDLIGNFEGGLRAAAWSPDQSRLALATGMGRLLLLSPSWDVLAEVDLPPAPQAHAEGVSLAWRGDGAYLAVSCVEAPVVGAAASAQPRRRMRVYTPTELACTALGRTEEDKEVHGLQAALAWSPNGQLIGAGHAITSLRETPALQVSFFETNGLRHRELVLPGHSPVTSLITRVGWNPEGDLLAVELSSTAKVDGRPAWQVLGIWHRDNYRWFCKAEWSYGRAGAPGMHGAALRGWSWSRGAPATLHLCVADASPRIRVHTLDLGWRYSTEEVGNAGLVGTIAGGALQISALASALVPPPFAYSTLSMRAAGVLGADSRVQVNAVAWAPASALRDGCVDFSAAVLMASGHMLLLPSARLLSPSKSFRSGPGPTVPARTVGDTGVTLTLSAPDDMGELVLETLPSALQLEGVTVRIVGQGDASFPLQPSLLRLLTWVVPSSACAVFVAVLPAAACSAAVGAFGGGDLLLILRVRWDAKGASSVEASALSVDGEARGGSSGRVACLTAPVQMGAAPAATFVQPLLVATWDGAVHSFDLAEPLTPTVLCMFPEPCTRVLGLAGDTGDVIAVGISARSGRLYCHGPGVISPAASSLSFHTNHSLLLALSPGPAPTLTPYHMSELAAARRRGAAPPPLAPPRTSPPGPGLRAMEGGSRLVATLPSSNIVIVQATRGSLEAVTPRALALASIRLLLDARPFPDLGAAMEAARKARVDLNFLVDHCPVAFLSQDCLRAAVGQVAAAVVAGAVGAHGSSVLRKAVGADRWDLLLSDLREGSVTEGADARYAAPDWYAPPTAGAGEGGVSMDAAAWLPRASEVPLLKSPSKVNRVASSVRAALLHAMAGGTSPSNIAWCHPLAASVITSYARQNPADVEAVLRVVQAAAASEVAGAFRPPSGLTSLSGDAALAHAIVVCDGSVELLYAAALGCYDLPLAHAVSQRAGGMDPRETVPALARLARLAHARPGEGATPPAAPVLGLPPAAFVHSAALPSLTPSRCLDFGPPTGVLSPGLLRQRLAIDVHLGRWGRAADWACAGAYASIAASPPGGPALEDAQLAGWLVEPLPIGEEQVVSLAIEEPVRAYCSLLFTRGLFDRTEGLRVGGAAEGAHPSLIALARAVGTARAWWLLAGRWRPDPSASDGYGGALATGPPPRGATGRLFTNLCPTPFAAAASAPGRPAQDVLAAVSLLLTLPGAPRSTALAVCAVHATVEGAGNAAAAAGLSAPLSVLLAAVHAGGGGAEQAGARLGHLALVLGGATVGLAPHTRPSQPLQADRGARAGRVDLAALAAGTLAVPTLEELERVNDGAEGGGGVFGGAQGRPAPPTAELSVQSEAPLVPLGALLTEVCAVLSTQGGAASLAAARLQLSLSPSTDADEAVLALCEGREWVEAGERARAVGRPDLELTVVVPSLLEAAEGAVSDCESRAEGGTAALTALATCRILRARLPLPDLLSHPTPEEATLMARLGAEGEEGEGSVTGPASSVYTDASSVVSAASRASSTASLTSSGRFSHWNRQSVGQSFIDPRATLRLGVEGEGAGGVTSATTRAEAAVAAVTAAGTRQREKQERRNAKHAVGVARGRPGENPVGGKLRGGGRFQPGSLSEQAHLESELTRALPAAEVVQEWRSLAFTLRAHGAAGAAAAARLAAAYGALSRTLREAPSPAARRDPGAELRALIAAADGMPEVKSGLPSRGEADPLLVMAALPDAL